MSEAEQSPQVLPYNPINSVMQNSEYARRTVLGVLESYNSSYDALSEAVQNSMDALEDAQLNSLPGPYLIDVTIDIKGNSLTVYDTGVGMTEAQVCQAFAPSATFKIDSPTVKSRGDKYPYRGYKGVGLTFLAYGSDDVLLQSRQNGKVVKGRLKNGRRWADGESSDPPMITIDQTETPLDKARRGTLIRVQFSQKTKPAMLSRIGASLELWEAILRTRTAIGQVLIGREPVGPIKASLKLIRANGLKASKDIEPTFYYPHLAQRNPPFRFLNVWDYHKKNPGITDHAPEVTRQDGIYLEWDTDEIKEKFTEERKKEYEAEMSEFKPRLYAFRPYHSPLWTEIQGNVTGQEKTHHLSAGLVIAVNRQRLADVSPIQASRSELLARSIFCLVHFEKAKPDQGRKTLQTRVMELANFAADAAAQYLLKQNALLKPAGEKTTAAQRAVEKGHEDWVDNVKGHAKDSPLAVPPISYVSTPITEQDVVGLYHQMTALGLFPGLEILATSAAATYDCYARFQCKENVERLRYDLETNPLGLSTDVLGLHETGFATRGLTIEFKNNLDGLIEEIDAANKSKTFSHIDICVCWSVIEQKHRWYRIEAITEQNLHERKYPGVTHVLRKDDETRVMQVVMLEEIVKQINAGRIKLPVVH